MKIVAVTNIKGGVGKTTTAVNLAYLCAAGGQRTVLWDLDPQGAASFILRCDPNDNATAKKLVGGKRELPELLVPSGYDGLDVIPSDLSYRNFDVHLSSRKHPTERLLKMSRPLRDAYDVLFLDCPPGISLLTENVLRAADALVVPLLPTPLSVRMLVQLRDFLAANGWADVQLVPFFSMVDGRKSLHHEVIARTREQFSELLATEVPYWSEVERMSLRRAPIPAYAPRSAAGRVYAALWSEIAVRMAVAPLSGTVAEQAGVRTQSAAPNADVRLVQEEARAPAAAFGVALAPDEALPADAALGSTDEAATREPRIPDPALS